LAAFKSKPLPAELNDALRGNVVGIPTTTTERPPAIDRVGEGAKKKERKAPPVYQINFAATQHMAELIANEAQKFGSTRRFMAHVLEKAGYEVSEFDRNPVDNRKRVFR
jgi:hypothetical protein